MAYAALLDSLAHGELSSALNRAIAQGILQRRVITVRQSVEPEIYRHKRYIRQPPRDILTPGINVALLSDTIAIGFARSGLFARETDDTWHHINTDQLRARCTPTELEELISTATTALSTVNPPPAL